MLQGIDLIENFLVLGKSTDFRFVPNLMTINAHIENTASSFDQLAFDPVAVFKRIRQTGGCR